MKSPFIVFIQVPDASRYCANAEKQIKHELLNALCSRGYSVEEEQKAVLA